MEMTERRLKVLARQKRIQEERAEERKPAPPARRCPCGTKLNSMNDSGWCALCRAKKVRAGKPGRAPSD